MSTKLFERTDSSGLVTTAVFMEQAPSPAAQFFDLPAHVDSELVLRSFITVSALGIRLLPG